MPTPLATELYYLSNFRIALAWVSERYADLLTVDEQTFIETFHSLAWPAQGLLVRMIMRRGCHFRLSRLNYPELGDCLTAAHPLLELGWISEQAPLTAVEITDLLRKDEMLCHLPLPDRRPSQKKAKLVDQLLAQDLPAQPFAQWCPALNDRLLSLQVDDVSNRLRLMFFGNLSQDWSEFVLADLGIYRYESVEISPQSRGFRCRQDLEDYLHLHALRLRFEEDESVEAVLPPLLAFSSDNPYLHSRHARQLFQIAQHLEKCGALEQALGAYQHSEDTQARWRQIRVLEQLGRNAEAHEQALAFSAVPRNDEERQRLERALTRLRRKLGLPVSRRSKAAEASRLELTLPTPGHGSVEMAVRDHLSSAQAPVHYVENGLLCSLFGLLCWEAIFAPLPGAFFHPFHRAPVDLYSPDFHARRQDLFNQCLARLQDSAYPQLILERYREKVGIQSPFVFWSLLDEPLLEQALHCIPAQHLQACFTRLLLDVKANRAGMPDLIQFYPHEQRYRMIKIKGPGDRLQDNQKRWLAFAAEQGIPVDVCYVSWDPA
ncbi:VRR-NUC domain-containing protein [Stutzerimonas stutzeri]|uniref:VRR-NUC domain-containing protein n=1 Tax=Stutzerimonas stutzeri TaxID=316 RepID=UPI00210990D0|nr:VRR-NUC domain-containing protein [Stutzerimonas stutzeri]MCQ4241738.1 VRR-NUC domain-containing protein [Stutzerimonas stutzeri]